eukprot:EG_transcript_1080
MNSGFVISILDAQSSPGGLLNNVKTTLPQTEAMLHSIDVFCSLDDTLCLSVFHYCNDHHELEQPSETDLKRVLQYVEAVQLGEHSPQLLPRSDFSEERLQQWLWRCPASFLRSTFTPYIYRMYLLDTSPRNGQPVIAWFADPDNMDLDLPLRVDGGAAMDHAKRTQKQAKLATAFWIYGCVSSMPNIKVLQLVCRVLLAHKLNIEQTHTTSVWDNQGKLTILFSFLVFPMEDHTSPVVHMWDAAEKVVADLRQAAVQEMAHSLPTSPGPDHSKGKTWFSEDSSENVSSEESSELGASTMWHSERSGYLLKQRRHGVLRLWQKRWVNLTGHILAYSKPKDSTSLKTLDVLHYTVVLSDARKHAFCLTEADGKSVLCLACNSEQERAQWLQAIKAAQKAEAARVEAVISPRETDWDTEVLQRYHRDRCLGRGATGKVWKVLDRETGEMRALKMMCKDQIVRQHLEGVVMAEKAILQRLRHPFVVGLHASFETPTKLCLLLDYYSGGTLQDLLEKWTRIPQSTAQFYATEIALALKYLHSQNIIHRDLKASNVLITGSGHAILSDFGIASCCREATTFCGTPDYLAPEVVSHRTYTAAVDWWCYGVALYHMLSGVMPFASQGTNSGGTIYRNILSDEPDYPSDVLSAAAISVLKGLLQKDPAQRFGFDQLGAEPFFADVDWDAALQMKIPCPYLPDF